MLELPFILKDKYQFKVCWCCKSIKFQHRVTQLLKLKSQNLSGKRIAVIACSLKSCSRNLLVDRGDELLENLSIQQMISKRLHSKIFFFLQISKLDFYFCTKYCIFDILNASGIHNFQLISHHIYIFFKDFFLSLVTTTLHVQASVNWKCNAV